MHQQPEADWAGATQLRGSIGSLPWGRGPDRGLSNNMGSSALVMIAFNLEQGAAYNALNFADVNNPDGPFQATNLTNATAFRIQIGTLLCPSDQDRVDQCFRQDELRGGLGERPADQ